MKFLFVFLVAIGFVLTAQAQTSDQDKTQLGAKDQEQDHGIDKEVCTQEKDSGKCRGYFENYYFNSKNKTCELFVYGGCGGNANRFDKKEECQKTCS